MYAHIEKVLETRLTPVTREKLVNRITRNPLKSKDLRRKHFL